MPAPLALFSLFLLQHVQLSYYAPTFPRGHGRRASTMDKTSFSGSIMAVGTISLLALAAAATSPIMVNTLSNAKTQTMIRREMFVSSSPISPSCKSRARRGFHPYPHPYPPENLLPSTTMQFSSISLAMSKSPHRSLQEQIIQGATLKLRQKDSPQPISQRKKRAKPLVIETSNIPEGQFSYYVREGQRSEIKEIADVLMDSFHHGSQLAFDSYIRRYKINHLQMCFDGIEYRDRGLFVACAVPASPSPLKEEEQIVGFCCVDGRAPDPSCKLEFLTPSTLAGTSPRPYLSDLGVCVVHRRRGIGEKLVHACEEWTNKRGYEKLYLKVEKNNAGGLGLYSALGYKETKLPWGRNASVDARWDTTVLLEKPLTDSMQNERRKRSWIKNQVWKPLKNSVERYSGRVNDGPPL